MSHPIVSCTIQRYPNPATPVYSTAGEQFARTHTHKAITRIAFSLSVAAGAAPDENSQRPGSAHSRHSLTKGKFLPPPRVPCRYISSARAKGMKLNRSSVRAQESEFHFVACHGTNVMCVCV